MTCKLENCSSSFALCFPISSEGMMRFLGVSIDAVHDPHIINPSFRIVDLRSVIGISEIYTGVDRMCRRTGVRTRYPSDRRVATRRDAATGMGERPVLKHVSRHLNTRLSMVFTFTLYSLIEPERPDESTAHCRPVRCELWNLVDYALYILYRYVEYTLQSISYRV